MRLATRRPISTFAALSGGLLLLGSFGAARADGPAADSKVKADEVPYVSLLEAARSGQVRVTAEGTGDGRMSLNMTNNSGRNLNVVLPPGLIAQGATGQMGGMGMGMGGMGGGMGGMGGGMGGMGGGMGGGMMGGMGGGMRSVPATGVPVARLAPSQSKTLLTDLVSLNQPNRRGIAMPAKGERLELGDISQITEDAQVQGALRILAAEKAPQAVAQMVMWKLSGMEWDAIAELARGFANPNELSLARAFVERFERDGVKLADPGAIHVEIAGDGELAEALRAELVGKGMLGLAVESGVPSAPAGPAVACKVKIGQDEAVVSVAVSSPSADQWVAVGKFSIPVEDAKIDALAEKLAEGMLGRLVRVQLTRVANKGKDQYRVKIENYSPLVLKGLAVVGAAGRPDDAPKALAGLSLPPRRSLTVGATADAVDQMGLRKGVKVYAADLSGL